MISYSNNPRWEDLRKWDQVSGQISDALISGSDYSQSGEESQISESATIVKVIHNATLERSVLQRANITLANVFDTLAASRRIRGKQPGGLSLAALCRPELDKTIDKTQQTSDWTRRPLTNAQMAYATLDVEVLGALYARFNNHPAELDLMPSAVT